MAQARKTAKKISTRKTAAARTPGKKAGNKGAVKKAGNKGAGKKAAGTRATGSADEHPTVAMVRGLAEVIEAHSLSELIVDSPDLTLTLRRAVSGMQMSAPVMASASMPQGPLIAAAPVGGMAVMPAPAAGLEASGAASAPAAEPPPGDDHHVVTSPFVGTFYRRPNPDAAPYVEIGARVEKGAALCIVEAMKLMNEIEADATGIVVAVLVEDGEAVEYGQALFKIDAV